MTAVCNGAASTTKPGVPAGVVVDQQFVQSLLPPALAFLYPYLPYMHGLQIGDTTAFCAADPPTFSLPTPAQFLDFLAAGNLSNLSLVNTFLQNITKAYLWQSLCKCVDNSVPNAVVPPANPGNLPALNPSPYVALPPGVNCFQQHNLSPFVLPINQGAVSDNIPLYQYAPTAVRLTASTVTTVNPGRTCAVQWKFTDETFVTNIKTYCQAMGVNSTFSQVVPVPAGSTELSVSIIDDPTCGNAASVGSGTTTLTFNSELFCGQPPGAQHACCPPDPLLDGKINAILALLTTVQRYKLPFAYINGPTHSGVSGTGATVISRLIGVLLTVTAQPATKRTSLGNPSYIYDLGWVSVSDADGMIEEKRLTRTNLLWFPQLGELATSFNYFLQSGVTINWTELQPEAQ